MIRLYGPPRTSAGRVYLMLEELGLPYEVAPMDLMGGDAESPEYLKLNPNGKVPCLVDGDTVLWESVAINLYLADKYRPELLGRDAAERGQVYQWCTWSMTEFQPPLIEMLIQMVFVPEGRRDLKLVEECRAQVPDLLRILDDALAGRKHIVGDALTVADLVLATVVNTAVTLKFEFAAYRNLALWFEGIQGRPSWKKFIQFRSH